MTINVWSGLDYRGLFRFGEYESSDRREQRFDSLVTQLDALGPDVVFVQESNPTDRYTARLGRALRMDEVHLVVNAGVKVGSFGLPTNLKEGLAILARPELQLTKTAAWRLSGSTCLFGDGICAHLDEAKFALVGRVVVDGRPVTLVDVHLVASPAWKPSWTRSARRKSSRRKSSPVRSPNPMDPSVRAERQRRSGEVELLLEDLSALASECPVIVAGDFNATPDADEIRAVCDAGLLDAHACGDSEVAPTYDHRKNDNIAYTAGLMDARGRPRDPYGLAGSLTSVEPRRIDYIFLSAHFAAEDVIESGLVLDEHVDGVQASDHFGVLASVALP